MITALFVFLKAVLPTVLYTMWIFITVFSVFKRAEWGLILIIALIPQPNVYYQFYQFPLGKDMLDISMACVLLGIIVQRNQFKMTESFSVILFYLVLSYVSLWVVSRTFSLPIPLTLANPVILKWKDFAGMIFLFFLTINVFKEEKDHQRIIWLMALVVLFIGLRGFRAFTPGEAFSEDSRYEGPFWRVGLGSNHYGAFMVHYAAAFFGCFLFEKDKRLKILLAVSILFAAYGVLFSYSRGAYAAAMVALTLYGFIHKRSLLILVGVIVFSWNTLLPVTVVQRIQMTKTQSGEVESSAAARVDLWEQATDLFLENPILGLGYNGFQMKMASMQAHLTDTHNYYLKVLSEQGLVGFVVLCALLLRALRQGWRLFRIGSSSFYRGLGLGFLGLTISIMTTNAFGDRWSYLVLGGYFWVFWGLVDRGIINSEEENIALEEAESALPETIDEFPLPFKGRLGGDGL